MLETTQSPDALLGMSEKEFTAKYDSIENVNFLNYIESRIRFQLIKLINSLNKKGDIFIEVRKKTSLSAFNKIIKELKKHNGTSPLYLSDIVKDLIGCRIICVDEASLLQSFHVILRSEYLQIQDDGFEIYSAPFRRHENKSSRYQRLSAKLNINIDMSPPRDEEKKTNYESLHMYLSFNGTKNYDEYGYSADDDTLNGRSFRYKSETDNIDRLYNSLSEQYKQLALRFPIECQMRTMLEHLWALEEHKYVYQLAKSGLLKQNDSKIDLIKGAFTALKYHYSAIDDVRDIIRNAAETNKDESVFYVGVSKDINPLRQKYFLPNSAALKSIKDSSTKYKKVLNGEESNMSEIYNLLTFALNKIKEGDASD
jgi:ppGpp synthetase/RelA/SpoT-type nucleotidyltranferase